MKHLVLILIIICLSINILAKGQSNESKNHQVENLNHQGTFLNITAENVDFSATYYVPFKGTKYSQEMYITKEEEFFFWEEAYNIIDLSSGTVEKVSSDKIYELRPFSSNGEKVTSLTICHIKSEIEKGRETRTGVFQYGQFSYNLDLINLSKTYLIIPISKKDYEKNMGIIVNRPYLYLFVPKEGAKLKIENICGNLTIYSAEILVMYPKSLTKIQ